MANFRESHNVEGIEDIFFDVSIEKRMVVNLFKKRL
jgi:hypothetical protein